MVKQALLPCKFPDQNEAREIAKNTSGRPVQDAPWKHAGHKPWVD